MPLSPVHIVDWDCARRTGMDTALCRGVLKWAQTYLTGRGQPGGFLTPSGAEGVLNEGEILHYSLSSSLLHSWQLWHIPGKCVHIKAIKVSISTLGLNQVRVFRRKLVNSTFFCPHSDSPLKSLYLSHLRNDKGVFKRRMDDFFLCRWNIPALICIRIWGPYASWQDLLYNMVASDRRLSAKKLLRHIIQPLLWLFLYWLTQSELPPERRRLQFGSQTSII